MEVTKKNFKTLLPKIKKDIDEATFASIDCELTGLYSDIKINSFDTQKQYYEKIRRGSRNFIIIQFGLCLFKYDKNSDSFKQNCYNFYIFPRQHDRNIPDRRFLCQASSIDFLMGHDFDFNKLFKQGITYLNKDEETRCLENLLKRQKERAEQLQASATQNKSAISVPITPSDDDREFIEKCLELIDSFLTSGEEEEIVLPKCNAFLRRLMYQAVERYGADISLETRVMENKDRVLIALKTDAETKTEREKQRCKQELDDLQDAVGFSVVIQHLADSGKPVVGHNIMLDILHVVDKFLTPLPTVYEDFKECLHCVFPRIIDTKFMASNFPFKENLKTSVLGDLFTLVQSEPFIVPKIEIDEQIGDCGYDLNDSKEHEAGYDAFITGVVFLAMSQYLGKLDKSKKCILPDSGLLRPFFNKIHLMRVLDFAFINLGEKDLLPPRNHVLHITFPKEWKNSDINKLFSPFGNIYIGWIDDSSAYVSLSNENQANQALKALGHNKKYSVITYAQHYLSLEKSSYQSSPVRSIEYRKRKLQTNEPEDQQPTSSIPQNEVKSKQMKVFSETSSWD